MKSGDVFIDKLKREMKQSLGELIIKVTRLPDADDWLELVLKVEEARN